MSNLQQSDLILAGRYVDGDLSAQEIASVESRIATDSEFLAAVDRIRQQSKLINRLPQFKPADDLADRTLQASIDQVQAIVGVWPAEDAASKPSHNSERPLGNSDWKSTIALIASLAGVVMLGLILWQNTNGGDVSNIAMQPNPVADADMPAGVIEKAAAGAAEVVTVSEPENFADSAAAGQDKPAATPLAAESLITPELQTRSQLAIQSQPGGFAGGMMGTPAKVEDTPAASLANDQLSNVAQIWCVNPDRSVPKNSVSDILQSNQIKVRMEEKNQLTSNTFDAYYVAATPRQMKQVLTEISNEANIEMFPLPQGSDSLIAEAIDQQFQQSGKSIAKQAAANESIDPDAPKQLVLPQSNALAQQLVLNPVPKAQPPLDPPPILKSDSLDKDLAMKRSTTTQPQATRGIAAPTTKKAAIPDSHIKIDRLLDDSDQRLQQYLILVHADEKTSK